MSEQKQPGLLELLEQWEKQGASDAEKTLWMNRYLDAKARNQGIPLHGTFELTPLCNLDCKMCYVHLTKHQLNKTGKRLLTVQEWKHIMKQAVDSGMTSATLTGGEALTYPAFDELFLFLQDHGVSVSIKSNGILMTKERVEFFKKNPPSGIQITLYGSDDNSYEAVTGMRCFEAAIAGIRRVKEAGIPLEICITPSKPALNNMEALLILAESLDVPIGISAGLLPARTETGRDSEQLDLSLDEYVHIYKMKARIANRELVTVCEENISWSEIESPPVRGLPCGGGRSSFAVHWNGTMHPCLSMQSISTDVLSIPFEEAWRIVHEAVANYPFPGKCMSCEYRGICTPCVLLHEAGAPPGQSNPSLCKRAKRLIAEGLTTFKPQQVDNRRQYDEKNV